MMLRFKDYLTEFAPPDAPPAIVEKQPECDIEGICKIVKTYESAGNEKKARRAFKDSRGNITIGHGHLVTKESEKVFQEVFQDEHKKDPNFGKNVISGKGELDDAQMERLLQRDVKIRVEKLKKDVPDLHKFSSSLQGEMVSEYYRGLLPASKNTIRLINSGDLEGAAKEYKNSKDYATALKNKEGGIVKRIDNLSNALQNEAALRKASKPKP